MTKPGARKPGLCVIALFALTLLALARAASAAAGGTNAMCQPDLWNEMIQRAHVHGQQDMATMENEVYKPDSVFEYTCFNQFMNISIANMTYYMRPDYVLNPIETEVTAYLAANYNTTLLGGRTTTAFTMPGGAVYTCAVMPAVWDMAKCMNLTQFEPQDDLMGVQDFMQSADIRRFPAACPTPATGQYGTYPLPPVPVTTGLPANTADCGAAKSSGFIINVNSDDSTLPAGGTGNIEGTTNAPADGEEDEEQEAAPRQYTEGFCYNPNCDFTATGFATGTCTNQ